MKKSVEAIKTLFNDIGMKQEFGIPVTLQAQTMLSKLDWEEKDWNKFVAWWLKEKVKVCGGALMEYLYLQDAKGGD